MLGPQARLVLVETAAALPGLLPAEGWDALRAADVVLARDPDHHPSAPYLAMADVSLEPLAPAGGMTGVNLLEGGGPGDRPLARALLDRAQEAGSATFLLGPADEHLPRTVGLMAAKDGGVEVEFVFLMGAPRGLELLRLVEVMARLRDPEDGCPWDLEQDHHSLSRYLLEETYELLEAIESEDDAHLAEELGDVLLQVLFHAQVALDRGAFDIDRVAAGITDKLVRRHPHVFADGDAETAEEVQANWDQLKAAEKSERTSPFDGVPAALPSLMLTHELQRKAAKLGFDWPDADAALAKVREELDEVLTARDARDEAAVADEVGDLLAAVAAFARKLDVDPEAALRRSAGAFRDRFEAVLRRAAARDVDVATLDVDGWLALWEDAKAAGF